MAEKVRNQKVYNQRACITKGHGAHAQIERSKNTPAVFITCKYHIGNLVIGGARNSLTGQSHVIVTRKSIHYKLSL